MPAFLRRHLSIVLTTLACHAALAQGADHALRMELEEEQFAIVTSLGRPVYALPPLREGVDASGVRVLAQELNDQAEW